MVRVDVAVLGIAVLMLVAACGTRAAPGDFEPFRTEPAYEGRLDLPSGAASPDAPASPSPAPGPGTTGSPSPGGGPS